MADVFEVELPLPPDALTPNGRVIWQVKMGITKRCRQLAEERGRNARIRAGLERPLPPPVRAILDFYFKTDRRHDEDNLTAGMKAYWDGLVDAGVLRDDRATMLHVMAENVHVDRANPRVVIRLVGRDYGLSPLASKLIESIEQP